MAAAGEWKIQPVSIRVVAPEGGEESRSFCWKPGVTVSVIFAPPEGKIVELNQDESKVNSFTDDRGTDLMAAPPSKDFFNKPGVSFDSSSKDHGTTSAIVDLKASGHPAKGATILNISGTLSAQVADSTKDFTIEGIEIKTNAQFKLGDIPVIISEAGMKKGVFTKKEEFSVTFSSAHNLDSISTLDFFDSSGKHIEANKRSWGGGFSGYMIEYVFEQTPNRVKIVATCWQGLKTVDVPFTIKTGVGL